MATPIEGLFRANETNITVFKRKKNLFVLLTQKKKSSFPEMTSTRASNGSLPKVKLFPGKNWAREDIASYGKLGNTSYLAKSSTDFPGRKNQLSE